MARGESLKVHKGLWYRVCLCCIEGIPHRCNLLRLFTLHLRAVASENLERVGTEEIDVRLARGGQLSRDRIARLWNVPDHDYRHG